MKSLTKCRKTKSGQTETQIMYDERTLWENQMAMLSSMVYLEKWGQVFYNVFSNTFMIYRLLHIYFTTMIRTQTSELSCLNLGQSVFLWNLPGLKDLFNIANNFSYPGSF